MRPVRPSGPQPWAYVGSGWLAVAMLAAVLAPHIGAVGQQCAYAVVGAGSAVCVMAGVRLYRPAYPIAWWLLGRVFKGS